MKIHSSVCMFVGFLFKWNTKEINKMKVKKNLLVGIFADFLSCSMAFKPRST